MIKEAINKVVQNQDLTCEEMVIVMNEIMGGESTPAQIASFITGLRMKGETIEEITGAAKVMRDKAFKINVQDDVIDTCGTGGDCQHTFNISTVSALVVAGAGVKVAKHGNRSVSSKCGSADLLANLGVKLDVSPDVVERCIQEIGIGFLFAPLLHGAMKYAIEPRKEIGIRTIFNILGPLTNPAGATSQLLGVYDAKLTEVMAGVLKNLGSKQAFIVHGMNGNNGIDEVSIVGETKISELNNGEIRTYYVTPEDFGLKRANLDEIRGGDIQKNTEIALSILKGKSLSIPASENEPRLSVVLLNAAFALVASGAVSDIKEGIKLSAKSIDSGQALEKLEGLKRITNQ